MSPPGCRDVHPAAGIGQVDTPEHVRQRRMHDRANASLLDAAVNEARAHAHDETQTPAPIASMARRLTEAGVNYQMRLLYSKYHMSMDEFVHIEWLLSTGLISPEEADRMLLSQIRERVLDPEDTELVSGPAAQTSVSLIQTPSSWEGAAPAPAVARQPAKEVVTDLM